MLAVVFLVVDCFDADPMIFVEESYSNTLKQLIANNYIILLVISPKIFFLKSIYSHWLNFCESLRFYILKELSFYQKSPYCMTERPAFTTNSVSCDQQYELISLKGPKPFGIPWETSGREKLKIYFLLFCSVAVSYEMLCPSVI